MKETFLVVFCTVRNIEEAKKISYTLIEKRLAACCTILLNAISIYPWQNRIEETKENLMIIKTSDINYENLEKEIKMMHSYTVPEIIAFKIENGSEAYLDWIKEITDSS
jgi:periplasmic divalent cation tolerance protein